MHSSRVGDIIHAKKGWGLSKSYYIIGIAKAAVFPDPVSASPIMSLPLSVYGNDSAYILDGCLKPRFSQAVQISGHTPSSKKVVFSLIYLIASSLSPSNEIASFLLSSSLTFCIWSNFSYSFVSALALCFATSAFILSNLSFCRGSSTRLFFRLLFLLILI